MAVLRYKIPLQVTFAGHDSASGKPVRNVCYFLNQDTVVPGALAPGDDMASTDGPSLLVEINADIGAQLRGILSVDFITDDTVMKEVVGITTIGPASPIAAATNTTPINVTTTRRHNLRSGDRVNIAGSLGNTAVNGVGQVVTVTGPKTFTVASTGNGVYVPLSGTWANADSRARLVYGNQWQLPQLGDGTVAGEALPLIATVSLHGRSSLAGRNGRMGMRLGPIAESDVNNGSLTNAARTAASAAATSIRTALPRSNIIPAGTVQHQRYQLAGFSFQRYLARAGAFADFAMYISPLVSLDSRNNTGSLVRRKPKLTQPIVRL